MPLFFILHLAGLKFHILKMYGGKSMCGIFGITTNEDAVTKTMEGIKKLEYRGYDSAGIAFFNKDKNKISVIKKQGEISFLEKHINTLKPKSNCVIAHTRWATHGEPSDKNSHPHASSSGEFVLVHNGIIENYNQLKETYLKNTTLVSQTDTEVIVELVQKFFDGNVLSTLKKVCSKIKGSYAFCLLYKGEVGKIFAVKKDSPLVVAKIKNYGLVASDVSALVNYTNEQYILNNNEYAIITNQGLSFFNKNLRKIKVTPTKIEESEAETLKTEYEHFMLKEINEIPNAVERTLKAYPSINSIFKHIPKKILKKTKHIKIIACGTAYHAALIAKFMLDRLNKHLLTEVHIASEFRYSKPNILKNTLSIFVSQSGETADTIGALKLSKDLGAKTLAITNVKNSSITYEADYNIYTEAGREVAVASTKAYNSQLALLYLIAVTFNNVKSKNLISYNSCLNKISNIFKNKPITDFIEPVKQLSEKYQEVKSIYLIGRQLDYLTAIEASLKLKEITYIHCEAYPSGELKHGTISLIEKDSLVICFITQKEIAIKTISALEEVKSRGAKVILISSKSMAEHTDCYDELITLSNFEDVFMPLVSIIPVQLLAYFMSIRRDINPDKPRNLAKAVTVE
jgi:glutamine---fructose-6-phosphate transaminase (isomerizing)